MIELQLGGDGVDITFVRYCSTGRREVLGELIAEIGLGRLHVVPISGNFKTAGIDRNQVASDSADSGLGKQFLNDPFRLFVSALAELMMPNTAVHIHDVERRQILII